MGGVMLSKSGGHKADVTSSYSADADSNGRPPSKLRKTEPPQTQRREANYLQVIARAPSSLTAILTSHPYDMPAEFLIKLKTSHDVQSMNRKRKLNTGGGDHIDSECVMFYSYHII